MKFQRLERKREIERDKLEEMMEVTRRNFSAVLCYKNEYNCSVLWNREHKNTTGTVVVEIISSENH